MIIKSTNPQSHPGTARGKVKRKMTRQTSCLTSEVDRITISMLIMVRYCHCQVVAFPLNMINSCQATAFSMCCALLNAILAGQNLSNLDNLFVGNTLGHKSDIADGSLRGWEFRKFGNLVGDYCVSPRFLDAVTVKFASAVSARLFTSWSSETG